ncbi:Crp/Fnr family transcriptional regulator [Curvibacter sp. RS43]|uniref:Crp/Fnr family transcriptional regulator n=1 Tax=Curvibacter microcysteis TaxID=3026419 RepID=UPI00235E54C5|nr:Crp/Fnr family transcriptional regulator [Curvibacter sp. RS43]MDD0812946.1 Crp/Fnr family transcriptional regulator [Curvibacter sp. RS43]
MSYPTADIYRIPSNVSERLLKHGQINSIAAGKLIARPDSTSNPIFHVISGNIRTFIYSNDGRQFGVTDWKAGYWFGEAYIFPSSRYQYCAESTEDSVVAFLSPEILLKLYESDHEVLYHMHRLIASRYQRLVGWLQDSMLTPLPKRIATVLSQTWEATGSDKYIFNSSQDHVAEYLGVSRQAVNKILKKWAAQGHIEIYYGYLIIKNPQEIISISKPN